MRRQRWGTSATFVTLLVATSATAGPSLEAIVARVVRQNYPSLHRCYRRALADDRGRGGTLFVRATLGRGGRVAQARIERDELDSEEVAACVTRLARRWILTGARAAGADLGSEVVIPITFRPDPSQFVIRRDDLTPRPLPGGRVQRLLRPANAGARQASLALLTVEQTVHLPAGPRDQALFVLRGKGWIRDGSRSKRRLAGEMAAWIPPGREVWIDAAGGPVELLHLEVTAAKAPGRTPKASVLLTARRAAPRLVLAKGRLEVVPLLDREALGHERFYLGLLAARRGMKVPAHAHGTQAELLYLRRGRATTTLRHDARSGTSAEVTREVRGRQALYLPAGALHWLEVGQTLWAVQVYAPAGPEQRFFKAAATAGRIIKNARHGRRGKR